jgi:type VII secretion-associated serine protease mycosin
MRRFTTVLLVLVLALMVLPAPAPVAARGAGDPIAGELLVNLWPGHQFTLQGGGLSVSGPGIGLTALNSRLQQLGATTFESLGAGSGTYLVRVRPGADVYAAAAQLRGMAAVRYAEPNLRRTASRVPNDPVLNQQWGLRNVQAAEAWDITTGGPIVVAVVDTGVDGGHPDLSGKLVPGYNAFANNGDAGDDNGHGTAVAGLIAANTDNGTGIAGLCWGCRIMPIKSLNRNGGGSDATVAAGIRWAADNGARVINLSLGGSGESQTLGEAVNYALERGIIVIAASGNERQEGNAPNYPAAYPDVLAVGATGNSDVITGFSNTGDYVDISAPGVGLWSTLPGGGYGPPNGTSFSSPYVAGAASLVLTLRPELGFYDVSCVLMASSDDKGAPGKDPEYGWGRLNVLRAVQLAQTYTGCPLAAPQPQPEPQPQPAPQPAPVPPPDTGAAPPAFAPVPPPDPASGRLYFPETGHSLGGAFRSYWEANGGLAVFGFPTSEEFTENGGDGLPYTVQYFERHRFEFHPDKPAPYNVLLARIGDDILRTQGRDWFSFPKTGATPGCLYFEATGQALCEPFLSYWRSNGLEFDGQRGKSYAESLALFGQPISPPQTEEVAPGVFLTVQWFERARFENHDGRVLLGLLGNELTRSKGWR